MIDHVFLTVSDMDRSVSFYSKALQPLGLGHVADFDGAPGERLYYAPGYYAGNVFDPDGDSLEFVYKPWTQTQS